MSEAELIKIEEIKNRIYTIRSVQVMLDKDLAAFYEVKPIRLREQVKRNSKRFPPDFMFQLTEDEVEFMVSQNAIPSKQHLGDWLPFNELVADFFGKLKTNRDQIRTLEKLCDTLLPKLMSGEVRVAL